MNWFDQGLEAHIIFSDQQQAAAAVVAAVIYIMLRNISLSDWRDRESLVRAELHDTTKTFFEDLPLGGRVTTSVGNFSYHKSFHLSLSLSSPK